MSLLRAFLFKLMKGFTPCALTPEQETAVKNLTCKIVLHYSLEKQKLRRLHKMMRKGASIVQITRILCSKVSASRIVFTLFMFLFGVRSKVSLIEIELIFMIIIESPVSKWLDDMFLEY